jgi:hypothetical protein
MGTPYKTVLGKLKTFGSAVVEFNQVSYQKASGVTESPSGHDLEDGYCTGACVDWIRRSLLGPPERLRGYTEDATKREANVERMVFAWAGGDYGSNILTKSTPSVLCDELRKLLNEQAGQGPVKIPDKTVKQLMAIYNMTPHLTGTPPNQYLTRQKVEQLANMLSTEKLKDERVWTDFAGELDEEFAQQRRLRGRNITSRPFSYLAVFKTSRDESYASAGHWMHELTNNAFRPGCATMISFKISAADNTNDSHTIAVHQIRPDKYHFFDANFGVFDYSNDGLERALQYLFWDGFNDRSEPYYGEDGATVTNKVQYVVFGKKGSANPFEVGIQAAAAAAQ